METLQKNKLGHGIYTASDISRILGFSYAKVSNYLNKYWDTRLGKEMFHDTYSWSVNNRTKAVNFYVLIELYTFIKLQEEGVSTQQIFKTRQQMAKELKVPYPFAYAGILSDGRKIWYENKGNILNSDGTRQINIREIIKPFLKKIEFSKKDNLAERFYPEGKKSSVVVDPHHQFGLPVIKGTNINTAVIYSMHESGEKIKSIGVLYDLTAKQVKEAIRFHKGIAA